MMADQCLHKSTDERHVQNRGDSFENTQATNSRSEWSDAGFADGLGPIRRPVIFGYFAVNDVIHVAASNSDALA